MAGGSLPGETRERGRIESTPDHLVLQLYLSGGFAGEMGGENFRISRGQIAICDLRHPLAVEAVRSSTIGLSVPRTLLDGIDLDRLPPRLDPVRERLLAARMSALHRRLPTIAACDVHAATVVLVEALHRLFDPSTSSDLLEAREFDEDRLVLIDEVVADLLRQPNPSPELIAERLRVSRATLYRLLAPAGGVMQHVLTMRLEAVRAALDQPSDPRTLSRLAADHGFKSAAHLSQSFRTRYGVAPRDWRAQQSAALQDDWKDGSSRLNDWWRALGR